MNPSNDRAKKFETYANETYASLVKEAAQLREKSLLSQREVANQLGLNSHSGVASMENMKTVPKMDNFLKILAVYGYTVKIVPREK